MDFVTNSFGKAFFRVVYGLDANIPKYIIRRRKENAPKPLPNRRARNLSISFEGNQASPLIEIQHEDEKLSKRQQYWSAQRQSPLITSLPPEIRAQIWGYIIASYQVHIVRARKRLWAIECAEVDMSDRPLCCHKCWGISDKPFPGYHGSTPGYCHSTRGFPRFGDGISLLRSCRLIYSETVNILYQQNTFLFNHIDTILSVSQTTLLSRFQSIRKIKLAYSFSLFMFQESEKTVPPYDASTWHETCRLLASITALKELYIHLGGWNLPHEIQGILEPLHQIRQTDVFDVSLSMPLGPEEIYQVEDRPFRFVSQHYEMCPDGVCC